MRLLLSIFFTFILLACGNGRPSGVLSKEKMEKVLWDVAQGSEFVNGYVYLKHPELNRAAVNDKMLERILKINKISRNQFEKSLEYYKKNTKQLTEILDSITAKHQSSRDSSQSNTLKPRIDNPLPVN